MPLEIEAKIKVTSHEPIVSRLRELGALSIRSRKETNYLFDDSQRSLRTAGHGLRVRVVEVLQGEPCSDTLTFKGPVRKAALKVRPETEVCVRDGRHAVELLQQLGYSIFLEFEKLRSTWQLNACTVELDDVPHLGSFVEVEGPDEETVRRTVTQLALHNEPNITKSYVHMLLAFCKTAGITETKLRLDG